MFSCDTMALRSDFTVYGENMLAKNSDRPTAEAQLLRVYEAKTYEKSELLKLTDLKIPQVASTYATVGSQPYWTWGFESGFNEKGLIIGNEAQGSKNFYEKETGILGLDLLRLALERAKNCREGISVITSLLEKYGQNANASALRDRRYENSYLLVDKNEVWQLETAGREWAARQIKSKIAVSNCYSIENEYDMCSENLEERAYKNRWILPNEKFNFAKAYTLPAIRQAMSIPRMRRMNKLLDKTEKHSLQTLSEIMRDHFDGEITAPRFGVSFAFCNCICMHPREWGESETAASIVCRNDRRLGVVSRFAAGIPCLSVYMPIYFTGYLPDCLQTGGKEYSDNSLWWRMKRLNLLVSIDDERFAPEVQKRLCTLEKVLEKYALDAEKNALVLLDKNRIKEAHIELNTIMDKAAESVLNLTDDLCEKIASDVKNDGGIYGIQKDNITKYCEYAKINLF